MEDDSGEYYCDACEERRHPDLPVYSCVQCSSVSAPYTAHLACELSSNQVLQSPAKEYESSESVSKAFQYHQHHLSVRMGKEIVDINRCIVSKSSQDGSVHNLFLYCPPCTFLLHYHCKKLEIEIEHPTHPQHSLTLHVDATHVGPFFQCNACKEMCLCFIYRCSCCNFNLCVRCIRAMQTANTLKYEEHQLFLFRAEVRGGNCDFCGGDKTSARFICMDPGCIYYLDFLCAPLAFPETIKCSYHEHTLRLVMDPSSNVLDRRCHNCNKFLDKDDCRLAICEVCTDVRWHFHASCIYLEILPELIAKFESSTSQEKVTRLNAEIEKLRREKVYMTARLKAIESQLIEAKNQLLENSRRIEGKETAISKLMDLPNASSE